MMKTKPRDMDDILREEGADAARAFRDSARLYERKSDGPFDEAYESGNGDANRKRFRLERFKDIKASTAPAYLIKGIIPRTGIVVIWGPPKCGKTFDTHDKVMHIAAGWPYRGRRVKQGPIVYVAAEGATGLRARTEAWRQHHLPYDPERDEHDVPFYMIDAQINLAPDADKLIAAIKDDLGSTVPAAVVLDTLNRTSDGSESKDEDMGRFLRAADMIQRAFNCVVIVVHHCGVEGGRPRGHTSLTGAADAQIAVTRDASGFIVARVEYLKDGPEGAETRSRLQFFEIKDDEGQPKLDDDGEPITSCIVVPADGEAASGGKKPKVRLNDNEKLALDALHDLLASGAGEVVVSSRIPKGRTVAGVRLWRETFTKAAPDTSSPDIKPDSARKNFDRAVKSLTVKKCIGFWDGFAWPSDSPDSAGQ